MGYGMNRTVLAFMLRAAPASGLTADALVLGIGRVCLFGGILLGAL